MTQFIHRFFSAAIKLILQLVNRIRSPDKINSSRKHSESVLPPSTVAELRWIVACVVLLSAIYLAAYATDPNVPGTHATRGWEEWWDQGQYVRSARAFAVGNFGIKEHFYPPGYSLLGSAFVRFTPDNPFVIPNFVAFLLFFLGFLRLTKEWLPLYLRILCFGLGTLYPFFLLKQYIYPWNTIPVAAALVWVLALVNESPRDFRRGIDIAIGLAAGVVLAVRQAEALVLIPAAIYYLHSRVVARRLSNVGWAVLGFIAPPVLVAVITLVVIGGPNMEYLDAVSKIGFSISDFFSRATFLFLDATAFNEQGAAIRDFQPFVIALLPASALAILLNWRRFAIPLFACLITFGLYITFNDFNPMNVVRYFLVHYIEWTFPIIIAGGVAGIAAAVEQERYLLVGLFVAATIGLMLVKTHILPDSSYQVVLSEPLRCGAFTVTSDNPEKIDAIDFDGASAAAGSLTSLIELPIIADGAVLKLFRDYRFIRVDHGLRLMFNSYVRPHRLEIELATGIQNPPCSATQVTPQRVSFWN